MSNKNDFMNVSTGVAVITGQSTYMLEARKPRVFDKALIKELAQIDDALVIQGDKDKTLLHYLTDLTESYENEHWRKLLDSVDICVFNWGAPDNALIGKPTDILNEAFLEIQKRFDYSIVPEEKMSFMLHKLGQPILPDTKLGWGHIKKFTAPELN